MKVSVLMPTYNHEQYIEQAILSFLAQECDFEIELLIGNDASTDNTLKIAQKYTGSNPEKIRLVNHKRNIGLLRNYKSIIDHSKGEYLAILESDDYWTDTLKLKKQVEFLDKNPSYGLSFTRFERLRDDTITLMPDYSNIFKEYPDKLYERFLLRNIIKSPTVCFRKDLFHKVCNIDDYIQLGFRTFDYPVWLSLIKHSDLHYISTSTAVYRSINTSISNNKNFKDRLDFEDNIAKIRRYIISLYGSGNLSMFKINQRELIVASRLARRLNKPLTAIYIFISGLFKNCVDFIFRKK